MKTESRNEDTFGREIIFIKKIARMEKERKAGRSQWDLEPVLSRQPSLMEAATSGGWHFNL